jgi:beta-xylosidase
MKTWDFVNDLLVYDESEPDLAAQRIIERPKVIYNAATQKWVMWMHVDSSDYQDARAGVATGDSICGDYTYIGSERPEGNIARDMTLFVDDDDVAYLVAEDRDEGTHFFRLSTDFLEIDSNVGTIQFSQTEAVESPAVFKVDGVYYFLGSRLTGWDPVRASILVQERQTG